MVGQPHYSNSAGDVRRKVDRMLFRPEAADLLYIEAASEYWSFMKFRAAGNMQ
jgi:hypothetical protein